MLVNNETHLLFNYFHLPSLSTIHKSHQDFRESTMTLDRGKDLELGD